VQFKRYAVSGSVFAVDAKQHPLSLARASVDAGNRITLYLDIANFDDEMYAEIVEVDGESLQVRALHDVYVGATQRILRLGDPFRVTRSHAFGVRARPA